MELAGRALVASTNQVWNLLRDLPESFASCCYLWVFSCLLRDVSWSSCQIGKPLAEGSCPVLWSSKATSPDFSLQHSEEAAAKDICWLCFRSSTLRDVCIHVQAQDRIPRALPARWAAQESGLCLLCCWGISQALRTRNGEALTCLLTLFLRFLRENPSPVTPEQQHRGPSDRSEQFSVMENLILKIIH